MSTDGSGQALEDPEGRNTGYHIFKKGDREPNNWRSVFGGSVWKRWKDVANIISMHHGKKSAGLKLGK